MTGVLKVGILGTLPNGEKWSVNPVYELPTGDFPLTFTELNTIATAVNAVAPGSDILPWWNVETRLTGVKLEHRSLTGGLLSQLEQTKGSAVVGTGAGNHPMQTSVVASLRTQFNSANFRGRLYFPATGATTIAGSLRFSTSQMALFPAAVKTYLSGIQTAISVTSAGAKLCVWSRTTAATSQVTRILVGDVPDVQRRRRDKAVETYNQTTFP